MAVADRPVSFLFDVLSVEFVDVNDFVEIEDVVDTTSGRASSGGIAGAASLHKFRLQYLRELGLFCLFLFFFLVF